MRRKHPVGDLSGGNFEMDTTWTASSPAQDHEWDLTRSSDENNTTWSASSPRLSAMSQRGMAIPDFQQRQHERLIFIGDVHTLLYGDRIAREKRHSLSPDANIRNDATASDQHLKIQKARKRGVKNSKMHPKSLADLHCHTTTSSTCGDATPLPRRGCVAGRTLFHLEVSGGAPG